jgi:predicted esterase YcpF (UPF0227 family)
MSEEHHIMILTGEDAKAFEEYDSRPLTQEEILDLRKCLQIYHKYTEQTTRIEKHKLKKTTGRIP